MLRGDGVGSRCGRGAGAQKEVERIVVPGVLIGQLEQPFEGVGGGATSKSRDSTVGSVMSDAAWSGWGE